MSLEENKFQIQDSQYDFPYHYIPYFDNRGYGTIYRMLNWGYEYLCYIKHIKLLIESYQPKSVLDVGCGDGRLLGLLSDNIQKKIGIDLSDRAIAFAKAFHPLIDFRCIDIRDVEGSYDLITLIEVLEHIPEEAIPDFLKNAFARLSDEGVFIISVPTTNLPLNKKHYRHYDLPLLIKHIDRSGIHYTIKKAEYVYYEPKWLKYMFLFLCNRFWIFELQFLKKSIWSRIWNKYRYASEISGHHLIISLRKGN